VYVLSVVYLGVALLNAVANMQPLSILRECLLYTILPLALNVDVCFFLFLLPGRLLGRKTAMEKVLSPSSIHKHLVNLIWILGEVGLYSNQKNRVKALTRDQITFFGWVLPFVLCALYVSFAVAIRSKELGTKLLKYLHIGPPEIVESGSEFVACDKIGNRTVIPGQWIYKEFKTLPMHITFVLVSLLFSYASEFVIDHIGFIVSSSLAQIIMITFIVCVTPILYLPHMWKLSVW